MIVRIIAQFIVKAILCGCFFLMVASAAYGFYIAQTEDRVKEKKKDE